MPLLILLFLLAPITSTVQVVSYDEVITMPPTEGVFDYQLGETYDTLPDGTPIDVVVRDASAEPLVGAYSICYINGFQTQDGEIEKWPNEPINVLLRDANGNLVEDPSWPGEYILDPSTIQQQQQILLIMAPVIQRCADAGFDAVEFDNLDTFLRFPGIDPDGAMMLAHAYIQIARSHNLAVAQKNTAELASIRDLYPDLLVEVPVFDFAIAESCAVWDECGVYTEMYGEYVVQVEYPNELAESGLTFANVCALPNRAPLTILRDRHLVGPNDPAYVYKAC